MDRGMVLFCLNGMLDNGLIYASIATAQNLLVVRFKFSETFAGSMCTFPYLVYLFTIPVIVKFQEQFGNRMQMVYFMGAC
jgi:hypothetical protein